MSYHTKGIKIDSDLNVSYLVQLLVTLMLQEQEIKSFAPLCAMQSKKFKEMKRMSENSFP
jgi:hypothetical protein